MAEHITPSTKTRFHKRGYLPHVDSPYLIQFITFRLAGSLPKTIFRSLQFALRARHITEVEYHRHVEKALDLGSGPSYLNDPSIAEMIAKALLRFDGDKYDLLAWVIMPNHLHLLLKPLDEASITKIIHSIKSFTASQANKMLDRQGRFWSADYYDRFIRDRVHFERAKKYIEMNPVKAGLCSTPEEWAWGSVGYRNV